jgi:hypothetical protein
MGGHGWPVGRRPAGQRRRSRNTRRTSSRTVGTSNSHKSGARLIRPPPIGTSTVTSGIDSPKTTGTASAQSSMERRSRGSRSSSTKRPLPVAYYHPKLKNLGPSRPSSWVSWAPVKSPSGTVIEITSRVMAMAKTASLNRRPVPLPADRSTDRALLRSWPPGSSCVHAAPRDRPGRSTDAFCPTPWPPPAARQLTPTPGRLGRRDRRLPGPHESSRQPAADYHPAS